MKRPVLGVLLILLGVGLVVAEEEAQELERKGRPFDALRVYRAAEEDFAGLQDVSGAAARVRELGRLREVKRMRAQQDHFTEEYTAYLAPLRADPAYRKMIEEADAARGE